MEPCFCPDNRSRLLVRHAAHVTSITSFYVSSGYYYMSRTRDNGNIPLQVHYWCLMNIGPFTTRAVVCTHWVSWIWTNAHWYIAWSFAYHAHGTTDSDKSSCYPWFVCHAKTIKSAMHCTLRLTPQWWIILLVYYTKGCYLRWAWLKRSSYLVYIVYVITRSSTLLYIAVRKLYNAIP